MTDAEKREKVIRGLECCLSPNDHENCPYDGIGKTYSHCLKQLVTDALALLKGQEPRVMTLEELKSIKTWNRNTPPYLWVEDITGRDNRWKYWRAIRESLNLPGTMGVQNYGSVWRVWNLRPTPEQMRDTKWEETDNG